MRTLYLDCAMGAAGDMLTAALYELLDDGQKQIFLEKMNVIDPENVSVSAERAVKCGICGTHMKVTVSGAEEDEAMHEGHPHDAHKNSHHAHGSMEKIERQIAKLPLSEKVRHDAAAVYRILAEAESKVHKKTISEIHFHEVGTKDALADVTAVCLLMEMLQIEKTVVSAVCVGSGQVRCAHGILPVPAPATAEILKNVPVYAGGIESELCTPTGAALLTYFAYSFGKMPLMRIEKTGYGMGKKDFERANCVRAFLGESGADPMKEEAPETVIELCCDLDDMTAERLGFAMETLLAAGALDVYVTPVVMKKSRPGSVLTVLCAEEKKTQLLHLLFRHTTTLGVRTRVCGRYTLARRMEECKTPFGMVRVKCAEGFGVKRRKYEYDDLARIAVREGIPIGEIVRAADRQD